MADLTVIPSLQLKETDILTVDKLNLMATPVVSLSIVTPVTDENFFRNGNYYSSFWKTPAGMSCPLGVETVNADYWDVNPNGAAVTCKRSTSVPDLYSLWSLELDGAANVTDCSVGQQIIGDLAATLRRACTFSGYIENNSGGLLSPTMEIWTADVFNNFDNVTFQKAVNLQTISVGAWAYETVTIDLSDSTLVNVANGIFIKVRLPSGALSSTAYRVNFSRLKFQLGEVATQFVDDPSLFLETPSVDATMLQDGCIARASLFMPNVIPKGAYQAGSIQSGDIGVGAIEGINLDPGVSTTTTAAFVAPAANANVNITVASANGISAGLVLNIQGAGSYQTVSVSGTVVTAQNTAAAGNASPGTNVPIGNTVKTNGNAVVGGLGYTPVNKAGDTGIGILEHDVDTVVGAGAAALSGVFIKGTTANANNNSYFPSIGFGRPSKNSRAIGLDINRRFATVDDTGKLGFLLDSVTGVDTGSYQNGSITLAALSQSLINLLIPPGEIRGFGGPNVPAGWLACDGQSYSTIGTYAKLFAAIGTYWGSSGGNTFNVPDLRGRSPIGYAPGGAAGITARAFATLGGEEAHVLDANELTYHNHVLSDGTHAHGVNQTPHQHSYVNPLGSAIGGFAGSQTTYQPGGTTLSSAQNANISIVASGANISISPAGGNYGHNNMYPLAVMFWLMIT
jgi:microcystin-dependent protein